MESTLFNSNQTRQEIASYHVQGIYSQTKVFEDQASAPNARELTLDDSPHSIRSFLRRPVDIANFKWTTGNLPNSELIPNGIKFPDVLLRYTAYQDKIRNFVGIRGSLMIRIKLNPQPYQQGTLLAYYIPNVDTISEKVSMIRASLSGKTGCPGNIEIDAQGATMYDIEVPYVSEFNFYNLLTGQGTYGSLFFSPYLQLRSKTQNDFINVTVQAYWTAPEPTFATGVDLFVPTESEQQRLHDNTLETGGSTHVTKDSLITTLLTDEIKPSTVLKTGANLLQLAGYQKPNIETGICQSHLQTAKFMSNYNGEQFSHSLGLSSTNKLEHPSLPASTNEDEMNLNGIMSKSNYYKTFTWNTSNTKGQVLFHDEVYPCKLAPSETSNVYNSTFVAFASSPFTMWKGSMAYHFKLAKTIYHSGSIRVSWCPGLYDEDFNNGVVISNNFQINMNYCEVYDIKETKEFIFVVPYTAATPALHNINPYSSRAKVVAKRNWCGGSIVVDVFTDLVVNETIAVNLIDVAVRVSGGSDLELIGATSPSFFPYTPSRVRTEGVTQEEGGFRSEEDKKTLQPITGSLKTSFLTSALISGECVTSVKNLLGRMALYGTPTSSVSPLLKICPFDFQKPLTSTSSEITNFDFLDYFSYLYGWYAGGVNLSIYSQDTSEISNRYYEARMLPGLNAYYPDTFERVDYVSDFGTYDKTLGVLPIPTQIIKTGLEGMAHLLVPYYNRVQITPALTKEQSQNNTEEGAYPAPIVYLRTPGSARSCRVFRSATDSFQFYYLLGPPQVVLLAGSAQLTPFVNPEVLMLPQKQTVSTVSGGFKVGPFFQNDSIEFIGASPNVLTPNTQFLSRYKVNSGDDWSLLVCPGDDTYSFTLNNDIQISKSGISFSAWNLLNGSLQSNSSSSTIYCDMNPVTQSTSLPIKMSTIAAGTVTTGSGTVTIPGINLGNPSVYGEVVLATKNLLLTLFIDGRYYPTIMKSGTPLTLVEFPRHVISNGRNYFFITAFNDDTKYIAGVPVAPYVLNEAI